jgi:hypothetical protein
MLARDKGKEGTAEVLKELANMDRDLRERDGEEVELHGGAGLLRENDCTSSKSIDHALNSLSRHASPPPAASPSITRVSTGPNARSTRLQPP